METKKVVLITGGAKRIGAAIARRLNQCDMDVIIHYHRSHQEAQELVDLFNQNRAGSAMSIAADLRIDDSYCKVIERATAFKGRLDVLINNASVFFPVPFKSIDVGKWQEIMDANLKAPFFLSQAAAPELSKNSGCIINITDIYADRLLSDHILYCLSKSGLNTMTKYLAEELAPEVRVNAIAPGAIIWPEDLNDKRRDEILGQILLKKTGAPADICDAVLFYIQSADYVTGQVLQVDGGRNLRFA